MASDSAKTGLAAQEPKYTPESDRVGGDHDAHLLETGIKPDARTGEETPTKRDSVTTAVESGQLKAALVQALEQRCLSGVETLLADGAIPNATDGPGEGRSLLQRAVENSEVFTDRFLVVKQYFGAVLDTDDARRLSRLTGGAEDTVSIKLREITDSKSGQIEDRLEEFSQALHEDSNQCQIIEALIRHDADLSVRTKEGETILHLAVCSAPRLQDILYHIQRQTIETLNVDAEDSKGRTPLHYAAAAGNSSAMGVLISHGADINARDTYNASVLHYAVECRACIAEALDHGATVSGVDKLGRSPGNYLTMLADDGEEANWNDWQRFQMQPGPGREERELQGRKHDCFTPIPRQLDINCVEALEAAYHAAGHQQWIYTNDNIGGSFGAYAFSTKAAHTEFKDQAMWVKKMKRRYKLRQETVKKLLNELAKALKKKLESEQHQWFVDKSKCSGAGTEGYWLSGAEDNAAEDSAPLTIYANRTRSDVRDGCECLLDAMDSLQ